MFCRPLEIDTLKIAKALSQQKDFVWIDSACDGDFSLLAFCAKAKQVFDSRTKKEHFLAFLREISSQPKPFDLPHSELKNLNFTGGWIGYFSYEAYFYSHLFPFSPQSFKPYPLASFSYYDSFVYVDHKINKAFFISISDQAEDIFHDFLKTLSHPYSYSESPFSHHKELKANSLQMKVSPLKYQNDFDKIKTSLSQGDYFELNYSVEFNTHFIGSPFDFYLSLRKISPAPMMFYMETDEVHILSASPECFFKKQGQKISTLPIKGTIQSSHNPEKDKFFQEKLFKSSKDRAELLMVTDMLRNDLGRICEIGSVSVDHLVKLSHFSHYHHLFSEISGTLKSDLHLDDIFLALFPGGSITGAPKVKVMEHIAKLEARARGIYTGALGLISNHGFMEFNIPIRTMVVTDHSLEFATGSGIVMDSLCESEYDECLLKASGIRQALTDYYSHKLHL